MEPPVHPVARHACSRTWHRNGKGLTILTQTTAPTAHAPALTRALDRVLRAERFWVPQWYKNTYTVAYYDLFARPETPAPYALGEMDFWWYDADKADALRKAGAIR